MTRTQLYLPHSQYEELKQLASVKGKTFAELVREYLEEKLYDEKRVAKKKSKKKRNMIDVWMKSIKRLEKLKEKGDVVRDGSINHDFYLYGMKKRKI